MPPPLQAWPPGVLSIDVDIVSDSAASTAPAYALLPARRLAIATSLDPRIPVGSFSAATRTRPNATQVSEACALVALVLPWLDTGACAGGSGGSGSGGPSQRLLHSLALVTAAVHPPATLARDGALGADAFEERARELYAPFTAAEELEAAEAVAARGGGGPVLAWGGGGLARARAAAGAVRVVVASVAFDGTGGGAPPGLFFGGGGGSPSGPVADLVACRSRALWDGFGAAGGGAAADGVWRVLATHVSLARVAGGSVLVSVAETAVSSERQSAGGGGSPPPPAPPSACAVVAEAAALGSIAADVLVLAGAACHRTRVEGVAHPGRGGALPESPFTGAALRLCESPAQAAVARRAGLVEALLLGQPLGNSAAALPPPPPPRPRATVCRELRSTGLHRELGFALRVDVPAPPAAAEPPPPVPRGAASEPPLRCELALVQRLEATQYIDLDEARDVERAGGAALRAFAKFVDVERPASASTQHVVVFSAEVHDAGAGAAAAGSSSGSGGGEGAGPRPALHGSVNVTLVPGGGGAVRVAGDVRQLLHLRYQNAGCGGAAGDDDGTFAWTAPADSAWLLLAQQPTEGAAGGSGGAGGPYISGCYARAHLQQPTVHLRCSGGAGGGPALRALAAALPTCGSGGSGAWVAAPVGNPSQPGAPGYDGACTPPLAPVPVGRRGDTLLVRTLTTAATLGGALLLLLAAATTTRGGGGGGSRPPPLDQHEQGGRAGLQGAGVPGRVAPPEPARVAPPAVPAAGVQPAPGTRRRRRRTASATKVAS